MENNGSLKERLKNKKRLFEKREEANIVVAQAEQNLSKKLFLPSKKELENALDKLKTTRNGNDIDAIDTEISKVKDAITRRWCRAKRVFVGMLGVAFLIFLAYFFFKGIPSNEDQQRDLEIKANIALYVNRNYENAFILYPELLKYTTDRNDSIKKAVSQEYQKVAEGIIGSLSECDSFSKRLLENAYKLYPSREIQKLLNKCE